MVAAHLPDRRRRLDLAGIPGFWGLLALTALACGMIFVAATGIYRRPPHSLTSADLVRIIQTSATEAA